MTALASALMRRDHVGPDQRRRNAGGMMAARGVGADIGQRVAIDRPVPDDIVAAAADRGVVVAARHRIADELLAFGQAERIELDHLAPQLWRHVGFVDRGAPGHIAGVDRLDLRQELRAHRGADAVGADQQIAAFAGAVGKDRGDAVRVLLDANEPFAEPIGLRRQRIEQSAVEPRPAAERARRRLLDQDLAVAVEADRPRRLDAHRLVEIDAGALEDGDELRMRAEPDAAARQFLVIALEHGGVPAGRAQQMRRDQPAERAADDEGAARTHLFPSPLWGGAGVGVERSSAIVDALRHLPTPHPTLPHKGGGRRRPCKLSRQRPGHAVMPGLVIHVGRRRIAVDQRAAVHRVGRAARLVLDREQHFAGVEVDHVLEAVLVFVGLRW